MVTRRLRRRLLLRFGGGLAVTFGIALSLVEPRVTASTLPAAAVRDAQHPYKLIDLGTFGGPQAGVGNGPYINRNGAVAGTADLRVVDPYTPNDASSFNGDPYVQHAFTWSNGVLIDRGAFGPHPARNSSYQNGINSRGDSAGISDNGIVDPLLGTIETEAVLWRSGEMIRLGTLGGNESQAFALNDRDQVVGVAANTVSDPVSMFGWGTQTRAFLWQDGRMLDLGTLGGPDSFGWFVNNSGQVAGVSYTSPTVNPVTGQPPIGAFLWDNGKMRDLGSLGGSLPIFGGVTGLNSRGEVVGQSDLTGDQAAPHPFLWNGTHMIDLGTLGGVGGGANAINDSGAIAGTADLPDQTHHAFVWERGAMHDLPPVSGATCSNGSSINSAGAVVGNATDCHGHALAAVLWSHGNAVDLNTLIAPSALHLTEGVAIDDRGEIIGYGVLPNGSAHNFLLIPVDPRNGSIPISSSRQAHTLAGGFMCATGIRRVTSGAFERRRASC